MRRTILSLALVACAAPGFAQTYPFNGTWDCGVAVFSFSDEIYNNGSENMPITDIAVEGDGYVLTFEDDYQLSVSKNADGTLAWFSPVSGDSFTCTAVN